MKFGPLEIRWVRGRSFEEGGLLTVNGHTYIRDWAVSDFLKEHDDPCERCGAPAYAHQINDLDVPACDLFQGSAMSRCNATKNGHRCHYESDHDPEQPWHFVVVIPNKYLC